jgi:hypothetical protein
MKDGLYYEYMPPPCAELAFSQAPKKAVDNYYRAVCADSGVKDVVRDTCCPDPQESVYWISKFESVHTSVHVSSMKVIQINSFSSFLQIKRCHIASIQERKFHIN